MKDKVLERIEDRIEELEKEKITYNEEIENCDACMLLREFEKSDCCPFHTVKLQQTNSGIKELKSLLGDDKK